MFWFYCSVVAVNREVKSCRWPRTSPDWTLVSLLFHAYPGEARVPANTNTERGRIVSLFVLESLLLLNRTSASGLEDIFEFEDIFKLQLSRPSVFSHSFGGFWTFHGGKSPQFARRSSAPEWHFVQTGADLQGEDGASGRIRCWKIQPGTAIWKRWVQEHITYSRLWVHEAWASDISCYKSELNVLKVRSPENTDF